MLYLSDLEFASEGSLDTINMSSIFELDKYDFKTEMKEMDEILSPYLSLLSPLDKTLFDMYFIHNAKVEVIADYLEVSSTAIYKRIKTINHKLKSIVYLNMDKETLFNFVKTYIINDTNVAKFIVQFVFQRTSKVGEENDFDFKTIKKVISILEEVNNSGADNISLHLIKSIKRNGKRHYAYIKVKRLLEVITYLIDKKAYRFTIFRGSLDGEYFYQGNI